MSNSQKNILEQLKQKFNQSGFEVTDKEGSLFSITSQSGNSYQIDERILDLTVPRRDKKVKIPKSDLNYELPENLYVALVILLKGIEPTVYLLPSKVFAKPDNYIFFDNEKEERFKHFSNWEIKVFTKGILELSKFALDNMIGQL